MGDFINGHAVNLDHIGFLDAVSALKELVEEGSDEHRLQAFIEAHPYILSEQFAHCHHVFPRVKLGERFEADFFCLDLPSSGNEWIAVEIERANIPVITKTGRKTAKLEHALQQLRDWRKWISDNIDYARRSRDNNGLGLEAIEPRFQGYLIIGRRSKFTDAFDDLRKQVFRDELITIRSWDGILERAENRAQLFRCIAEKGPAYFMTTDIVGPT